jgi:hypothetical protein
LFESDDCAARGAEFSGLQWPAVAVKVAQGADGALDPAMRQAGVEELVNDDRLGDVLVAVVIGCVIGLRSADVVAPCPLANGRAGDTREKARLTSRVVAAWLHECHIGHARLRRVLGRWLHATRVWSPSHMLEG